MTQRPADHASLLAALSGHPQILLAIVFGSVASGAAGAEGDLDLAVMGGNPLSAEDKIDLVESLSRASGRPVDLVDLSATHGALLAEILRTGVRILDDDPELYPALLRRHLLDEADFRPYRERILAERRRAWTAA